MLHTVIFIYARQYIFIFELYDRGIWLEEYLALDWLARRFNSAELLSMVIQAGWNTPQQKEAPPSPSLSPSLWISKAQLVAMFE